MSEIHPLRSAAPWKWLLRPVGVRDERARVELGPDEVTATFGPMQVRTALDNVAGYELTGPYRWWKAIGPRGSLADRGFTFGTSAHGGVCLGFRDGVPSSWVRGGRMESLTVTVDDPDRLAAALEARGIRGVDRRRR